MTNVTRREMIGRTVTLGAVLGMFGLTAKVVSDRPPIDPEFPDRIAVDDRSPFYDRYIDITRLGVTLNGVNQTACVEACQSEGWVRVFRDDGNGKLLVKREAILTERRYGVVRFHRLPES
jgi:hypothetical protein